VVGLISYINFELEKGGNNRCSFYVVSQDFPGKTDGLLLIREQPSRNAFYVGKVML